MLVSLLGIAAQVCILPYQVPGPPVTVSSTPQWRCSIYHKGSGG